MGGACRVGGGGSFQFATLNEKIFIEGCQVYFTVISFRGVKEYKSPGICFRLKRPPHHAHVVL